MRYFKYFFFVIALLQLFTPAPSYALQPPTATPSACSALGVPHLVIVGVGDVIDKYYLPALIDLQNQYGTDKFQVTFIDDSAFWRDDPSLTKKMQGIIAKAKARGFGYVDKSSPQFIHDALEAQRARGFIPDATREDFGQEIFDNLNGTAYIIATTADTHVQMAKFILMLKNKPELTLIEKPIDTDAKQIRVLERMLKSPDDTSVQAFDHYLARVALTPYQEAQLLAHLGGSIVGFKFYFLEDHSGADFKYPGLPRRNGAIEREQRQKALRAGMLMDGFSHGLGPLRQFAYLDTIQITDVRAGQYVGVDDNPLARAEIPTETFAAVDFVCHNRSGGIIKGSAFSGKNVRGVEALGPDYDGNVKMIEYTGVNGNIARYDLRSSGIGSSQLYLMNAAGAILQTFRLSSKPYKTLLEQVILRSYRTTMVGMYVRDGKAIHRAMEEMGEPIRDLVAARVPLATYEGGMVDAQGRIIRHGMSLEQIMARLPSIWHIQGP